MLRIPPCMPRVLTESASHSLQATGLSTSLARALHLVDALTRAHLTAAATVTDSGHLVAASVPFKSNAGLMTLLKGEEALVARRHVASKMTDRAIDALQNRSFDVEKPDFELMQQLFDAGIRKCPLSGMPVFDPSACTPALRATLWRHYCGVATAINTREFGRTDETIEELQIRLREHAKRKRASSQHDESAVEATSSDDEETHTTSCQG